MKRLKLNILFILPILLFCTCEKRDITALNEQNERFTLEINKVIYDICKKNTVDFNSWSKDTLLSELKTVLHQHRKNRNVLYFEIIVNFNEFNYVDLKFDKVGDIEMAVTNNSKERLDDYQRIFHQHGLIYLLEKNRKILKGSETKYHYFNESSFSMDDFSMEIFTRIRTKL